MIIIVIIIVITMCIIFAIHCWSSFILTLPNVELPISVTDFMRTKHFPFDGVGAVIIGNRVPIRFSVHNGGNLNRCTRSSHHYLSLVSIPHYLSSFQTFLFCFIYFYSQPFSSHFFHQCKTRQPKIFCDYLYAEQRTNCRNGNDSKLKWNSFSLSSFYPFDIRRSTYHLRYWGVGRVPFDSDFVVMTLWQFDFRVEYSISLEMADRTPSGSIHIHTQASTQLETLPPSYPPKNPYIQFPWQRFEFDR